MEKKEFQLWEFDDEVHWPNAEDCRQKRKIVMKKREKLGMKKACFGESKKRQLSKGFPWVYNKKWNCVSMALGKVQRVYEAGDIDGF